MQVAADEAREPRGRVHLEREAEPLGVEGDRGLDVVDDMVAVIDGLTRKGLVERERDPVDRRAYSLRTTPEGRRLLRRALRAVARAEDRFLARIPEADGRRLRGLLRDLIAP